MTNNIYGLKRIEKFSNIKNQVFESKIVIVSPKIQLKRYFSDESPLFWTQVDLNKIKTVQDLSEEIVKKHQNRIKKR